MNMSQTDRTIMVLTTEVRRMADAAERVRLVTEALAKRRKVRTYEDDESSDISAPHSA